MITIVDYGVGNIASLLNMLDHLGIEAEASGRPDRIERAERLILPGVGAFDKAMATLMERQLTESIRTAASRGAPVLGVCLGMQLLADRSEEGVLPGLGLITGNVVKIEPPASLGLKVPNTGWAYVQPTEGAPLFDPRQRERFYFVHSYHFQCADEADVAATIDYGGAIVVGVSRGNVHGVQFHPEKSHRYGMRLLAAFAEQ